LVGVKSSNKLTIIKAGSSTIIILGGLRVNHPRRRLIFTWSSFCPESDIGGLGWRSLQRPALQQYPILRYLPTYLPR
jgi:hypothetical protein